MKKRFVKLNRRRKPTAYGHFTTDKKTGKRRVAYETLEDIYYTDEESLTKWENSAAGIWYQNPYA